MKNISLLTDDELNIALKSLNNLASLSNSASLNAPALLNDNVNIWVYDAVTKHIKARFKFAGYGAACAFAMRVGLLAELQNHHPEVSFGWGYVEICVTTHDASGISELDIWLATSVNAAYGGL